MAQTSNIFYQMISKIESVYQFEKIIEAQSGKFDIRPYKIDKTFPEIAKKIYEDIAARYQNTRELQYEPNCWHQNERRIFVWFIAIYCFFKENPDVNLTNQEFTEFSPSFFGKSPDFLQFQYLNLLKVKNRILWTPEEDALLRSTVCSEKAGKWNQISKLIYYETGKTLFRSPKHCRQRWLNHLDTNKVRGSWLHSQDYQIFNYVQENGKKWSKIVLQLKQTRTEHMIKNRFNSLVSKFRTQKKQKQEQLVKRICKQLKKDLDNSGLKQKNVDKHLKQYQQLVDNFGFEGQQQEKFEGQASDRTDKLSESSQKASNYEPFKTRDYSCHQQSFLNEQLRLAKDANCFFYYGFNYSIGLEPSVQVFPVSYQPETRPNYIIQSNSQAGDFGVNIGLAQSPIFYSHCLPAYRGLC